MPTFIILDGVDAGREFRVKQGASAILGRGEDANVQVVDKNASRHHARLTRCEGLPTLVDLGSANGTMVNGLPITQIALLDGDEVKIGETRIRFLEEEQASSKGKSSTTSGLKIRESSGTYHAVAPPDVTTQAFRAPQASERMDALYDTYTKLKSVYRALQAFVSAKTVEELTQIAADSILLAVACDRVAIFLADEEGKALPACQAWRETVEEKDRTGNASVDSDLINEMSRLRAPAFFFGSPIPGAGQATPLPAEKEKQLRASASQIVGAPILEEGRVPVGVIIADTPVTKRELNKNDLDLVGTLAQQMAAPLGKLRRMERLEKTQASVVESARDGLAIVTRAPAMQPVLQMVRQVAPTEATVLVIGESGTGKELLARAVHNLSMRRDRPMVCVNCAALPEALIESELFGHEKGAFTGAFTRRPGKFEAADGGTIFLDEIGEIPLHVQGKLLRVLQEGEIQRLGSTQPIVVNARVICATNVPLEKAVKEKKFREDLYYRVRVVEINVPPLRERFQDIPALAQYYLEFFRKKFPSSARQLGADAMQAMMHYRWPGNVRELRNVIERAIVLARDATITLRDLPAEISANAALGVDSVDSEQAGEGSGGEKRQVGAMTDGGQHVATLADIEKRHIRAVLSIAKGNKAQAAKLLGISRTTLYEKIKLYSLDG